MNQKQTWNRSELGLLYTWLFA